MNPPPLFTPDLFKSRHILVTGGGTGIGFGIAREFGLLGARVTIASRNEAVLADATRSLRSDGTDAAHRTLNIRDESQVGALFESFEQGGQLPDFLINNAGGQFVAPALDISPNGFRAVMDLNVQGTWNMCSAFARSNIAKGRVGKIVNLVFPHTGPMKDLAHAAAARAAVVNLTRTLALEWGQHGIHVNAVGVGYFETTGLKSYDDAYVAEQNQLIKRQPIPRMGETHEIARLVCFLCSPAGDYMTGVVIPVDGGGALVDTWSALG
jgi:NAD(P)-dependent dehydrogenase (short-subunit alcohol dehydrogenase family)